MLHASISCRPIDVEMHFQYSLYFVLVLFCCFGVINKLIIIIIIIIIIGALHGASPSLKISPGFYESHRWRRSRLGTLVPSSATGCRLNSTWSNLYSVEF